MKKTTTLAVALALTLLFSGLSFAMDMNHGDMNHGDMKAGDMSAPESMKAMQGNLDMMKMDVAAMKDPAARQEAMKAMNGHMADMHHGMAGMEAHAKKSGDHKMEASMKQMNKDMMTTMKGMGMMKKDADKGMSMMNEGLDKMEKTMMQMKGMM
ncbi:hypothetical protein BerOc1_03355 [Pseudodesulfovibrio hydrargyri]|uniref:Pentapeptide MXKDX repeat protein n=1 Tax=Pseudodesulfovibrio hydrargyri TaxID=2125990 RepID=A0A1J5MZI4_9BACT|nr:hypothetical protein [Pseudodesulfovibrio hydrargyri]OIQ51402.1 hypothetical protein BerOc1_03355 [Pseudodesulfovibrio hydrargyri]